MVRQYKRKTSPVDKETMKSAVRSVRRDKVSIRAAAKLYKLTYSTLNSNIISGFICTGIYPFNENIFQEYEYMPSVVTDRPLPSTATAVLDSNESSMSVAAFEEVSSSSSNSTAIQGQNEEWINLSSSLELLNSTLETIRPYPKAPPRKVTKRGRKKRKSEILTSSPVMKSLRQEQTVAAMKKAAKEAKASRARLETKTKPAKPVKPPKPAKPVKPPKPAKPVKPPKSVKPPKPVKSATPAEPSTRTTRQRSTTNPVTLAEPPSTSRKRSSHDDDDDDAVTKVCCVCYESFVRSDRCKVCVECRFKAHSDCVRSDDIFFICPNCFSEPDDDSSEVDE